MRAICAETGRFCPDTVLRPTLSSTHVDVDHRGIMLDSRTAHVLGRLSITRPVKHCRIGDDAYEARRLVPPRIFAKLL